MQSTKFLGLFPPCFGSALTRGGNNPRNHPKPQNSPLRGAKNRRKTSFLGVSEQVRITKKKFSAGKFCCETKGAVGCGVELFHGYRNASLLFTKFIYKPHRRGPRSFHGRRNALLPFAKSIGAVPDVFTRVGTRRYHSQNVFTCCIGAVPGVFTRVYYSQN